MVQPLPCGAFSRAEDRHMCWWVGGELEGGWGRETFPKEVTSELRPRRWERSHPITIWGRTRAEVLRWDPVLLVGEKERGLCLREESGRDVALGPW